MIQKKIIRDLLAFSIDLLDFVNKINLNLKLKAIKTAVIYNDNY